MRLLSHNLLMCNVKTCDKNNYPLAIVVDKSYQSECEFKKESLVKLIPKLNWEALHKTVLSVSKNFLGLKKLKAKFIFISLNILEQFGELGLPKELPKEKLEEEQFLRFLHKILMEVRQRKFFYFSIEILLFHKNNLNLKKNINFFLPLDTFKRGKTCL